MSRTFFIAAFLLATGPALAEGLWTDFMGIRELSMSADQLSVYTTSDSECSDASILRHHFHVPIESTESMGFRDLLIAAKQNDWELRVNYHCAPEPQIIGLQVR